MNDYKLGTVESRFADIVWEKAPLTTGELVKICGKEMSWKRTTTYTVLKKLCDRGLFCTENSIVSVQTSKEDYYAAQSQKFVAETFDGSLPAFIAAFTKKQNLSSEEIAQIISLIDTTGEE